MSGYILAKRIYPESINEVDVYQPDDYRQRVYVAPPGIYEPSPPPGAGIFFSASFILKYSPLRAPSYVTVMLNVTDAADGFPFTPRPRLLFSHVQSNRCACRIRRSSLAC
jgi:hypothetical protein